MTQDRLLSDEELVEYATNFGKEWEHPFGFIVDKSIPMSQQIELCRKKMTDEMLDLINNQKRLYAESKVVEYAKAHKETLEKMHQEAEQRARIK